MSTYIYIPIFGIQLILSEDLFSLKIRETPIFLLPIYSTAVADTYVRHDVKHLDTFMNKIDPTFCLQRAYILVREKYFKES